MNFLSADQIRGICGGTWLARLREGRRPQGVGIDSRAVKAEQVFVAIKGETHDGHDHVEGAIQGGAAVAVVEREGPFTAAAAKAGAGVLKVLSTRKALGKLAHAHRKTLDSTRVIAVGGSNGKTTTVRLIESVLRTKLRGAASPKSFNNDIGVPLTILSARPGDQYLICEVGTNAPGEIAALAAIVEPDIAVIVSIGREHLEGLGSIEGVAREEAALLGAVRPGGLMVVTADAPALAPLVRTDRACVRFGSAAEADLRLSGLEQSAAGMTFGVNGHWRFSAPLHGEHNARNCLAAIAVARRFNIDDELIGAGLAAVEGAPMRWQTAAWGDGRIINDAYNANPESMLAALKTFAATAEPGKPRWLVLGDMLELGAQGPAAHAEIGRAIVELGAAEGAVLVGPLMAQAAGALRDAGNGVRVVHVESTGDEAVAAAALAVPQGAQVLIKGSRGMRLERVAAALAARGGGVVMRSGAGARA